MRVIRHCGGASVTYKSIVAVLTFHFFNFPVFYTVDFIGLLDFTDMWSVVFVHDPRGHNFGFYYLYEVCVDKIFLYACCDRDVGPMRVLTGYLTWFSIIRD